MKHSRRPPNFIYRSILKNIMKRVFIIAIVIAAVAAYVELRPNATVESPFATTTISPGDAIDETNSELRRVPVGLLDTGQRGDIAREIVANLSRHSAVEEMTVYPEIARAVGDDVADSLRHEHHELKEVLASVEGLDPSDDEFARQVREAQRLVAAHVAEEESNVLPGMRERLDDARRAALGEAFAARRAEHMGDRPGEATRAELELQARTAGISRAATARCTSEPVAIRIRSGSAWRPLKDSRRM